VSKEDPHHALHPFDPFQKEHMTTPATQKTGHGHVEPVRETKGKRAIGFADFGHGYGG
jgi:hypothetical protein